jgi:hypothetical protein
MSERDILEPHLQSLGCLATGKMRAARRHRSWHYARRAQRLHLSRVHPNGVLDCACERSVWSFEKRKSLGHSHRCRMCHPKYRDTGCRPRVKRYMQRWGLAPRPWMITGAG